MKYMAFIRTSKEVKDGIKNIARTMNCSCDIILRKILTVYIGTKVKCATCETWYWNTEHRCPKCGDVLVVDFDMIFQKWW